MRRVHAYASGDPQTTGGAVHYGDSSASNTSAAVLNWLWQRLRPRSLTILNGTEPGAWRYAAPAAVAAAIDGSPLAFVETHTVPQEVASFLNGYSYSSVRVVGPPSMVSDAVAQTVASGVGRQIDLPNADRLNPIMPPPSPSQYTTVYRGQIAQGPSGQEYCRYPSQMLALPNDTETRVVPLAEQSDDCLQLVSISRPLDYQALPPLDARPADLRIYRAWTHTMVNEIAAGVLPPTSEVVVGIRWSADPSLVCISIGGYADANRAHLIARWPGMDRWLTIWEEEIWGPDSASGCAITWSKAHAKFRNTYFDPALAKYCVPVLPGFPGGDAIAHHWPTFVETFSPVGWSMHSWNTTDIGRCEELLRTEFRIYRETQAAGPPVPM